MTAPLVTPRFEAFTLEHLGLVAGFLVVGVALVLLGRAHRGTATEVRFRRGFALLIPVFTVPMQVLQLLPGDFDLDTSLPLQLCDFAWVPVAWALLTRHPLALSLTYYWGLTLSLQALAQPTLDEAFPDPNFFAFWGKHVLLVWGAVYATLTLRQGPSWRGYRQAVVATALWVAVAMSVNGLLDTNYGYFNGKPKGTVLDYLGPWPWYVLAEVAIVAAAWAVITLPWVRKRGPSETDVTPGTARDR